MFKATCSKCGKECEVPFRPTGSKPVYCRDCFRTIGGPYSGRTNDRGLRKPNFDNGGRGSAHPQYREQFDVLNAKLDNILKLLNPEKSMEAPKIVAGSQAEDATKSVGNIKPLKKKIRAKKLASAKAMLEAPAVIETLPKPTSP